MESSEIVRRLIVLICIFNPVSLLAMSARETRVHYHVNHSKIISLAICGALSITILLYVLSAVASFLLLKGQSLTLAGGAVLMVFVAQDFQKRTANGASKESEMSERPDRSRLVSAATIPSIVAVSFLISDTQGSPSIYLYVVFAAVSLFYFTLLGIVHYRRGGDARPELITLRKIPSGIVLIVAIDMILISLWP